MRSTESSQGTWIRRSWLSQASASGASRLSGLAVVGDDGLAREVAAGHHEYVRARRVAGKPEEQPMYRAYRAA